MTTKYFTARDVMFQEADSALFAGSMVPYGTPKTFRGIEAVRLVTTADLPVAKPGIDGTVWTVLVDKATLDRALDLVSDYDPQEGTIQFGVTGAVKTATVYVHNRSRGD